MKWRLAVCQRDGCIYEINFRYHSKSGGYTTIMSDIPKLGETLLW